MLYDRRKDAVRAYCGRRTGSLDAADDVAARIDDEHHVDPTTVQRP
ncbi:hypothetical protein GCM10022223_62800 [Kineosporia mesophila]|uniref:Transposase n=1 Tax=Kineosporia mesophila TaxID=566012 RepID=A0ABP7AM36_9ACTN|nr:hypothetical protein [Kineosporia mesophila]MCD5354546.1 hypothetical protein [Kineosporia mesophila]